MTTSPELASAEPRHDRTPATGEELEQEGDVAADFLEGLLDIADIDGDLDLDVRAGRRLGRPDRGPRHRPGAAGAHAHRGAEPHRTLLATDPRHRRIARRPSAPA